MSSKNDYRMLDLTRLAAAAAIASVIGSLVALIAAHQSGSTSTTP